jgi:hypothetical protein
MKPLFISRENITKRAYRRSPSFKLAGGVVLAGLLLQIGFAYKAIQLALEAGSLASANRALRYSIKTANDEKAKYADLENKLADIHSWEPILTNRLPVSAVLAAIEQTIPPELVVSNLSIVAVQQTPVKLAAGVFMLPRTYQLQIEGERQKGGDAGLVTRFSASLLARMPANARQVGQKNPEQAGERQPSFRLVLELPANGNYHNLGLNPSQGPETL